MGETPEQTLSTFLDATVQALHDLRPIPRPVLTLRWTWYGWRASMNGAREVTAPFQRACPPQRLRSYYEAAHPYAEIRFDLSDRKVYLGGGRRDGRRAR